MRATEVPENVVYIHLRKSSELRITSVSEKFVLFVPILDGSFDLSISVVPAFGLVWAESYKPRTAAINHVLLRLGTLAELLQGIVHPKTIKKDCDTR